MHSRIAFALLAFASVTQNAHTEDRPIFDAFTGKGQQVEFEALVVERLRSDGFWSGTMVSYQGIRYQVTKIVSGDPGGLDVTVYHALVSRDLCEIDGDELVLSKQLFAVGNRLRLKVEKTPKGVLIGWERPYSVLPVQTEEKAAEPGATDNPDDAQRVREDH